jgi:Beta-lactamase class C and other penicillin binding proteins
LKEYIKNLVEKELSAGDLAGASLSVIKDSVTVLRRDYGYADLESKRPMPTDGIFRLYSLSKTITAVAAMILMERGVIDLHDPVAAYLDGFRNQMYFDGETCRLVKNECTLYHLLNMTSGLVYPDLDVAGQKMQKVFDDGIARALSGAGFSTVNFCNRIGGVPLAFNPGEQWRYGTSADVLGAVIEVASGKSFRQFLMDEVFIPLGMTDTDFYVPTEKQVRMVTMYRHCEEVPKLTPYLGNHLLILDGKHPPVFESGGAGLFSTVADYTKFASVLMTGGCGGARILGRKTLDYLRSNQLTPRQKEYFDWPQNVGYGYGNLMRVMESTATAEINSSVGEFGWDGWTGAYASVDPTEKLIILYFISRIDMDPEPFRHRIRAIIYGHLDEL